MPVKGWQLLVLTAVVIINSGCISLSQSQRARAQAVAANARSSALACEPAPTCALVSPLYDLGRRAQAESQIHNQAQHYVALLDKNEQSLITRLNLIHSATASIDLQTYIFDADDSARVVIEALLAAARRGVRVRVLIDQLSSISDPNLLAALSGVHINFALRLYNPTFNKSKLNYWDYAASVLCCFRRFNQRMHNKLLIIDGRIGITGGRNYQNDYFDWDAEYNFRDRDVLVAGPAVTDMSASFQDYWSTWRSVPVEHLNDVARVLLKQGVPELAAPVFTHPMRVERVNHAATDAALIRHTLLKQVLPVQSVTYWADPPRKHWRDRHEMPEAELRSDTHEVAVLMSQVQNEILLQTPYLVLSKPARRLFKQLHRRENRPRIVVSTNSLAATDNPIVYALSYKYKRRNLRELGFDIYEYKPFPLDPPIDDYSLLAQSNVFEPSVDSIDQDLDQPSGEVEQRRLRSETRPSRYGTGRVSRPFPVTGHGPRRGLHAKSMVIDRKISIIGTHNFDPRSENYNTEGIVVIDDAAFAQQLARSILRDIHPDNSWAVAPRQRISRLNYGLGKVSESLPILDLWPWRYATNYAFMPSSDCPVPLPQKAANFYRCYQSVGDFPEVDVGPKWLLVRMLTAFGAGLVPIL